MIFMYHIYIHITFICLYSYDHLDKITIKKIYAEKKNNKTKVFCPLGLKKWFIGLGIPENQVTECDWWDDYEIAQIPNEINVKNETVLKEALDTSNKKIIISSVPCQHFSGRTAFDNGKSLWTGWVIKSQDTSYYFAG